MFERVLKNTNSYFDEILHQILTPPLNLKIWCRLITHSPHPTIKLPRIQIFKISFRKLSILSKLREWRKWQGVGGFILFASLWRIAYENWYVAHPLMIIIGKNFRTNSIQEFVKIKSWLFLIDFLIRLHKQLSYVSSIAVVAGGGGAGGQLLPPPPPQFLPRKNLKI